MNQCSVCYALMINAKIQVGWRYEPYAAMQMLFVVGLLES
jgi:hypothetical protein